jgi:hypothetical protein
MAAFYAYLVALADHHGQPAVWIELYDFYGANRYAGAASYAFEFIYTKVFQGLALTAGY